MLEKEEQLPIIIQHLRPSDLPQEKYEQLGLADLMKGYGFREGLFDQAVEEYGDDGDEKRIFLALQGGKAVGSLVVKILHGLGSDDGGIYPILEALAPKEAAKLRDTVICNVSGVLVREELPIKGLADRFFRTMDEAFHPAVVVGRTKTPKAILARANSLARLGFRSWYGGHEVTPNEATSALPIVPIEAMRLAYARWKSGMLGPNSEMFVDPDILRPDIRGVSDFPLSLRRAYAPVIQAQQRENILARQQSRDAQTVVFPLISIHVEG